MVLWERQEGESTSAYNAFRTYYMTPESEKRTYAAVAEKVGKSDTLIRRWAKTWNWEQRTLAYDNHLVEEDIEKFKKERFKTIKRHVSIARLVQNKIIARLNDLNPSELSPGDLIKWLDISVKIERQALGEPTESIIHELTGKDGGPVELASDLDLSKLAEGELMSLAQFVVKCSTGADNKH
jgi:hypothetical protein